MKTAIRKMSHRGFGLIEMLVAVAIFALVVTAGAGAIFTMLDANQKSQTLSSVMTNLNIALEGMARAVRVGTNYKCNDTESDYSSNSCPSGSDVIGFRPAVFVNENDRTYYKLEDMRLKMKKVENGVDVTGGFQPVTADEIKIQDLKFYVLNTNDPNNQPRVLLMLKGYVETRSKNRSEFTLQTTMSQRIID